GARCRRRDLPMSACCPTSSSCEIRCRITRSRPSGPAARPDLGSGTRDRGGGFGLRHRRLGFPHGVGVVDLCLGLDVVLLGLLHHLLGLIDQAPGLRPELHGLGALDRVLGRLDLNGAVPTKRRGYADAKGQDERQRHHRRPHNAVPPYRSSLALPVSGAIISPAVAAAILSPTVLHLSGPAPERHPKRRIVVSRWTTHSWSTPTAASASRRCRCGRCSPTRISTSGLT